MIDRSNGWQQSSSPSWNNGLDLAETATHLMEAGELAAMLTPPTWEVARLREGEEDLTALKELIVKF